MNKILKILIAIALVGAIIFFGVRYYLEQKQFEESANAALMDMLIENNEEENENEKITYEDVTDENVKKDIEEYIDRIFLNFLGTEAMTEYTDVENVDTEYIEKLVFLNTDLIGKDESEANENGIMYFTYPEINQVAVKLLGKEVHNKFPNKTGDYFEKTTDGFSVVGMCGSETIAEKYVIDKIQKGSNGLFYIDMYDYTTEYEFLSFDVTIEDSGKKVYTKDANGKKVFEYTLDVIPYSEMDVTLKYLDSEGNEVSEEQMDEIVKENLDKLVKRTIVLEYDEELDLYYMKSNVLEKKAK